MQPPPSRPFGGSASTEQQGLPLELMDYQMTPLRMYLNFHRHALPEREV